MTQCPISARLREWAPIAGYPNYRISDDGRVYSRRRERSKGGFMRPVLRGGYQSVMLCSDGHGTYFFVHRLVLEHFGGPCPDGHQAGHLNGNRLDNRIENLRWVTPKENTLHKHIHGTIPSGEQAPSAKLTLEQAEEIRRLYKKEKQTDLAARFGVHRCTIQRIHSGKYWKCLMNL